MWAGGTKNFIMNFEKKYLKTKMVTFEKLTLIFYNNHAKKKSYTPILLSTILKQFAKSRIRYLIMFN